MNIEEAIKTALEYENKVRDAYRHAAEQATDPVGVRVLGALANEEQGHVDYLNHKLEQWTQTGKITTETLETVVPSPERIAEGLQRLEDRKIEPQDRSDEVALLKQALQLEVETGNFYRKMVKELDGDGRKLFERFVEIEEGHEAIVDAELNAVSGRGFWFDMQEFSLEGA